MDRMGTAQHRESALRLFDNEGLMVGSRVTIPGFLCDESIQPHGWIHGALGINREGNPILFTEEVFAVEEPEKVYVLTPEMVRRRHHRATSPEMLRAA